MLGALRISFLPLAAGVLFTTGQALATPVTSTTFSGWKATLTGAPTELDFNGVHYTTYNTSAGLTLQAVGNPALGYKFTGPDNGSYYLSGITYNGLLSLAGSSSSGADINVLTPSAGNNAILVSVGSTASTPITLTLSDNESFTLNTGGLFGMALTHPVTSLTVSTTSGSQPVINDFWFGSSSLTQDGGGSGGASPVPEGRTAMLVAGGILVLFGAGRRVARIAGV